MLSSQWARFRRLPAWIQGLIWLLVAAILAWVVAAAAGGSSDEREPLAQHGEIRDTTTTAAPPATTTTTPGPASSGDAALLAQVRVAPEPVRAGYKRELFSSWIDADGDGCNTREEVLIAESLTPAQVDPYGCKVVAGDWLSVYDGVTTEEPGDIEIDHVVALAEAWDSGASAWDVSRRRDFANDLGFAGSLIAVSSLSNQHKSDQDPAEWMPPRRESWCQFARDWAAVKVRWDLSADQPEVSALHTALDTCGSQPAPAPPVPAPSSAPVATTSTTRPDSPPSGGSLSVTALDCQGERVTVANGGSAAVDLTGWTIHDEGTKHTFSFPAGHTLAAGASVSVKSDGPPAPGELAWTNAPVWNNTGDTASLVDAAGVLQSTRAC